MRKKLASSWRRAWIVLLVSLVSVVWAIATPSDVEQRLICAMNFLAVELVLAIKSSKGFAVTNHIALTSSIGLGRHPRFQQQPEWRKRGRLAESGAEQRVEALADQRARRSGLGLASPSGTEAK